MKLAVLVSGRGTNLQALLDAEAAGRLAPAEVACVISNRADAPALQRAAAAGKPAEVLEHRGFADRAAFDAALAETIRRHGAEAVVLAGFMRILSAGFLEAFAGRVLNVHPSLLPAFPGLDAPRQALEHGVKVTGCTVHLVDAGVDTGPIIAQRCVPIEPDDDVATLTRRIQAVEHALLPEVVRLLARGAIVCEGRRVRVSPEHHPARSQEG